MRISCLTLACGLTLLAGCSHHDSDPVAPLATPTADQVPYGWHADALKDALAADTGDKKPYTCFLDFSFANPPAPTAAVTIPGLIERVDAAHATVQASSPAMAEKAIHAAVFIGTVNDCEAAAALRPVDTSFPADRYASLVLDPITTLANYYAFTGASIPYEKEAQIYDLDYLGTTDPFKRRDLLPAFKAKVDQAVSAAKAANGHVRVSFTAGLDHYDLNTHTFAFKVPFDRKTRLNVDFANGMHVNSDVSITFADSPEFNSVKVDDEAQARQIESAVNDGVGSVNVDVDAQVVGTQEQGNGQRLLILAPIALHVSSAAINGPHPHLFDIQ
jgi:hypothetical protein